MCPFLLPILGSRERQGEMLEEALKEVLERRFVYDRFEDVAKGKRGAMEMYNV